MEIFCPKCKLTKDCKLFNKNKSRKNGYSGFCVECNKSYIKPPEERKRLKAIYYQKNKEYIKVKVRKYNKNNKLKIRKLKRIYSNLPHRKQILKEKRVLNKDKRSKYLKDNKERLYVSTIKYRVKNRHIMNSIYARRRASRYNATPKWLTKGHLSEIRVFYKEAKKMEKLDKIKRHVDHIIPLQGETVCGLHVPWNLQILTAEENIRKKNKLLPEFSQNEH